MSKENVLSFLTKAVKDRNLKEKLKSVSSQADVVDVGSQAGYDFSSEHIEAAMTELKQKPGFFGDLAEAVLELFSPNHDDYPNSGVQPFSGDPNPRS